MHRTTARQALATRITYSCVNLPIEDVLINLADQADIDIVKSPKVAGDVTVKVTDVPLGEALTNILAAHDYTYVATESMIRVIPVPEVAALREQLVTRIYQLTYADANEVASALREFVSERGKIGFHKGTSHIIVTDTEGKIKAIDRFIERIDLMTAQVLVEVRIYEITSNEGFELGTEWSAGRNTPGIITQHQEVDSRRSGYDFDQLLPHMGDLLPRTERTTRETGDVSSTSMTGPSTTTFGEIQDNTMRTEESIIGNYRDSDDAAGQMFTNRTDRESRFESSTTTNTGFMETETVRTGPVTETVESGIRGFDRYYDQLGNSAFSKDTETKQYITRRRKPFAGASFDRVEGGTLSFSLLNDAVDLQLALHVLHQQVEAELLANPRVLVLDNETANFEIIREIPYREVWQVARQDPLSFTEFKNVGVQLKVTPHIARDGMIKLHIKPEFGILVSQNLEGVPTVDTRRADTMALIQDGQTIVMGGLRKRETTKDISKVPILGDLPLLGGLFKSETESVMINELVVFITTKILTEPVLSATEKRQFSQTEFAGPKMSELRLERPSRRETERTIPGALDVLLQELESFERQSLGRSDNRRPQ
jgi:type II secretory pathway component GspD/PulD (secretin)